MLAWAVLFRVRAYFSLQVLVALYVRTIIVRVCHELYVGLAAVFFIGAISLGAQTFRPTLPAPPQTIAVSPNVNVRAPRPNAPGPDEFLTSAVQQDIVGKVYHLKGKALVETSDMRIEADELDYNSETGDAEARGHVVFENFARGEKLRCDRVEYNTEQLTGKFYNVSGSAPSRIQARPGLLTTTNPFYFEGKLGGAHGGQVHSA